jgi:hypothetical protein
MVVVVVQLELPPLLLALPALRSGAAATFPHALLCAGHALLAHWRLQ